MHFLLGLLEFLKVLPDVGFPLSSVSMGSFEVAHICKIGSCKDLPLDLIEKPLKNGPHLLLSESIPH